MHVTSGADGFKRLEERTSIYFIYIKVNVEIEKNLFTLILIYKVSLEKPHPRNYSSVDRNGIKYYLSHN